ncbi:MAG: UbiA-like protein EboC, partial [Cytophagales bacterium]|nr:UbiA-like protein EboC [Cytophagales bacterium]
MSKIRAFAELTRPANVVTALSDIMAGLAIVGFVFGRLDYQFYPALFLGLSSMSLYAGGVVFNDVFDHELDSIERPERALPSGRINRSEAIFGGILLLSLGIFLAFWQSRLSGIVAIFITLFALFYDWKGKHMRIFGPINMGLCRAFNLLLGMSVYELGVLEHFPVIAIPLIYIAAITLVSRGEVHGGKAITLYFAGFLFLVVHASQLFFAEKIEFALVFVLAHFILIFRKLRVAIENPVGKNIGLTVKT